MVYIAPLPRGGSKQQQKQSSSSGGGGGAAAAHSTTAAAAAADARQTDQQPRGRASSTQRHAAAASNISSSKHAVAHNRHPVVAAAGKSSSSSNRRAVGGAARGNAAMARWQDRHSTTDDPAALQASQAALASQVLQRELAALAMMHPHLQCQLRMQPQQQQQHTAPSRHAPAAPAAQHHHAPAAASVHSGAAGSVAGPPLDWPDHHHQHHQHQPFTKESCPPVAAAAAAAAAARNHVFYDVAPKAFDASAVPGLGGGGGYGGAASSSSEHQPAGHAWHDEVGAPAASGFGWQQPQPSHAAMLPAVSDEGPGARADQASSGHGAAAAAAPAPTAAGQLAEELRAAQKNPDPFLRERAVRSLKQQLYKLELEEQIAARAAARRQQRADRTAKDAAEAAARAAAPPPWDPGARAARRGGGGEPHKALDGTSVADLRSIRHHGPSGPTLEASVSRIMHAELSTLAHGSPDTTNYSHQQPPTLPWQQQPKQHAQTPSPAAAAAPPLPPAGAAGAAATVTATAPAAGPGRSFMNSLAELRPGPSQSQRAAAAAARQQLLKDLEAQVAEKAARAAAAAAAEAARAAAEDAALQGRYASNQQPQLQQLQQQHSLLQAAHSGVDEVFGAAGQAVAEVRCSGHFLGGQGGFQGVRAEASAGTAAAAAAAARRHPGRSRRVIDAPWLDQLQQQQQLSPPEEGPPAAAVAREASRQHAGSGLWCESSTFNPVQQPLGAPLGGTTSAAAAAAAQPAAAVAAPPRDQELSAALQQVQQLQADQARMQAEFSRQAEALQGLMCEQGTIRADRAAAWAQLERVQQLMEGLPAQQQQQQDDLDAMDSCFVVETHHVPIGAGVVDAASLPGVNSSLQGESLLQPLQGGDRGQQQQRAAAPRPHRSRFGSIYGLGAEPSSSASARPHKQASRATEHAVGGGIRLPVAGGSSSRGRDGTKKGQEDTSGRARRSPGRRAAVAPQRQH